jgi:hypothetical protein
MEQEFELLTSRGAVRWVGTNGEGAAQRWADSHPGETVTAWRYPKTELRIGIIIIDD